MRLFERYLQQHTKQQKTMFGVRFWEDVSNFICGQNLQLLWFLKVLLFEAKFPIIRGKNVVTIMSSLPRPHLFFRLYNQIAVCKMELQIMNVMTIERSPNTSICIIANSMEFNAKMKEFQMAELFIPNNFYLCTVIHKWGIDWCKNVFFDNSILKDLL